jgi:hypothetical protein
MKEAGSGNALSALSLTNLGQPGPPKAKKLFFLGILGKTEMKKKSFPCS